MIPPIGILKALNTVIGILNAPGLLIGILIPPIGILKAHQSLIGILNAHESLIGILNGSGVLIGVLILQRYVKEAQLELSLTEAQIAFAPPPHTRTHTLKRALCGTSY